MAYVKIYSVDWLEVYFKQILAYLNGIFLEDTCGGLHKSTVRCFDNFKFEIKFNLYYNI